MTDKYSALLNLAEEYNRKHGNTIEIKQNEPMSRHTSFKIGGNADLYIIPHDMDALIETVRILKQSGISSGTPQMCCLTTQDFAERSCLSETYAPSR